MDIYTAQKAIQSLPRKEAGAFKHLHKQIGTKMLMDIGTGNYYHNWTHLLSKSHNFTSTGKKFVFGFKKFYGEFFYYRYKYKWLPKSYGAMSGGEQGRADTYLKLLNRDIDDFNI